ncbi:MAG: phosphatase PAP2 family protein [Pseudomonadota bacterium]
MSKSTFISLAEAIGPHRNHSRALVAFLVFALTALGTILLASEVAEGDTFAIDKMILTGLRHGDQLGLPIGPTWLRVAMTDFSALGGAPVLTLIAVFAVGYLLIVGRRSNAAFVAASIAGGAILSGLIKASFVRPRPELVPHLVDVTSSSFPSGHSMNSAIVFLTLAVLIARSEQDRRVQGYLTAVGIVLTLLVGSTRVYLGVHWPSDVLAGWAVGAMWAAVCSVIAREFQRRGAFEKAGDTAESRRG